MIVELDIERVTIEHNRIYTPVNLANGLAFALFFGPQETHLIRNGNLISGVLESPEDGSGFLRFLERIQEARTVSFNVPDEENGLVRLVD